MQGENGGEGLWKKRITEMQGDRLSSSLKSGHRLLAEGKNAFLRAVVLGWGPSSGKGGAMPGPATVDPGNSKGRRHQETTACLSVN